MISTERVLFEGRIGTQWLRVWLEYRAGTVVLALTAEGTADAVLDAVRDVRGHLAPDAKLEIESG
ncbi:MAG: hypothetical protein GEV08_24085 [Acidimicrobiia bacterium]|nr:hypothetical protein [Acidimicrobiia bacterium]